MTLDDIRDLVIAIDPNAGHYDSAFRGRRSYTVWQEIQRAGLFADNKRPCKSWRFQIDRFTKHENDAIAQQLEEALEADPRITYNYVVDYEPGTGYIRHIFDCEAAGA